MGSEMCIRDRLYDSKTKGVTLGTGDRVLVKVVAFDGKHKIADR